MSKELERTLTMLRKQFFINEAPSHVTYPYIINSGYCGEFAQYISDNLPKRLIPKEGVEQVIDDDEGHIYLRIGDKFYDAECMMGVSDKEHLPFYRRRIEKGFE